MYRQLDKRIFDSSMKKCAGQNIQHTMKGKRQNSIRNKEDKQRGNSKDKELDIEEYMKNLQRVL